MSASSSIERHVRSRQGAITLVEAIVMLAVLAVIVGAIMPAAAPRLESARVERAKRDVEELARTLRTFWRTSGVWPSRDASGSADGLDVLLSGAALPASNPWSAAGAWWTSVTAGRADVFDNHFARNRPENNASAPYPTTGSKAWRGPYAQPCPLDPWGRPYLALVAAGHSSASTGEQIFVLSAGPDGAIDTSASGAPTNTIQGDDIGLVAWRRS